MSMYFSITNAKDSAATAKLSSDAALLSKLGVLFLPVSLMTSYFSIQISELQGVYTAKTYWVTFAVIMVLSFLALFLFSSLLEGVAKLGKIKLGVGKDWLREMLTPRRLRQGSKGSGGARGMEMVGLKV
jgi:magnesium-transporting ATPase (P-type)